MVARYLSNRLNTTTSFKVDYKGTNNKVTGTSKGSNEGKDPSNDIKLNTPMKFLKGLG
jgi:hypothetical protein